ncbi:MAG: hypothetical protein ACI4JK_00450 [Oscillospiraceae bacterium]
MTDEEKIDLLKYDMRNEQFSKEPMVRILISMLIKKGILSKEDYLEIEKDFYIYMDRKAELFFDDLNEKYNGSDENELT